MQRIPAIDPAQATGKTKLLLDGVQAKLGVTPNMMTTMANSPAALEAYLNFSAALNHGKLGGKFGEQLALVTAQENSCEYCLAAHTYLSEHVAHLDVAEIGLNRKGESVNQKTAAGLKFAKQIIEKRGNLSGVELADVRAAGFTDGEIAEIVGHVALNILTNYFNIVAGTDVDFPKVSVKL